MTRAPSAVTPSGVASDAYGLPRTAGGGGGREPAREVGHEVVEVLEPDGEPDRAGADAGPGELLVRELAVRRRRRVDDEAPRVADVREVAPQMERLDEPLACLAAALDVEREDRPC